MEVLRRSPNCSLLCIGLLLVPATHAEEIAATADTKAVAWSSVSTPDAVTVAASVSADDDDREESSDAVALDLGRPVDESVLAAARGGAEQSLSENNLDALLEGNSAANLSTGNNSISEGAFSNSTGLPMVIQNSGNNVIIQNSTILNLDIR